VNYKFNSPPSPLFEKERSDVKMFFTIVPLSNSVRERELKMVSEKREGEMINISVR